MSETKEMFTPNDMKPADNKIITTAKCPVCNEMATVHKFGKGQGRISHHGHSVCFSSREVRALIEPEREPVTSSADRQVDQIVEPADAPERKPAFAPVDPSETQTIEPAEREPEDETLTFGVF